MKYLKNFEDYNGYNVAMSTYRTFADDHLSDGDVTGGAIDEPFKYNVDEVEQERKPKDREKEREKRKKKLKAYKDIIPKTDNSNDFAIYMDDRTPGVAGSPSMQSLGTWNGGKI